MSGIARRFQPWLQQRQNEHRYRRTPLVTSPVGHRIQLNGRWVINFSANDYLGLSEDDSLRQAVCADPQAAFGSGAAHLVSGHHLHHHLLEDELADWLDVERVLLFSTGYMANMAVQQALMQRGDTLIHDKLNHASLLDGARLSEATLKRYPHADMTALARRLQQTDGQALIVSDGVFSMDGDMTPLPEMMALKAQYDAWLLLDEAHAFGVVGTTGRGTFEHFGLTPDTDTLRVGTLGKAFGVFGAFVAGSQVAIKTLINRARPWIYTTALPPANALAAREALKCVRQADAARDHLWRLIARFRASAEQIGLRLMPSMTPIQPVVLGDDARALRWSRQLFEAGFHVPAIRPPTVPVGSARLRITFSARHTFEQVDRLLEVLEACARAES